MIYNREHNVVVYDAPPPGTLDACAGVKPLYNGYVAAPATLGNLQELTRQGLPVPPIMAYQYDWPRHKRLHPTPFKAQLLTANFLTLNPRAFVLSDMGTGKTLAALWAADFIMRQYPPGECRALIVCPVSTMKSVWVDALFCDFLGKRSCVVLHGSAEKREKLLDEQHDFYIVNHDGLGVGARTGRRKAIELDGFSKKLSERADIRICIVDECSTYRDAGTRKHHVAREVIGRRPYLWMMSGTPTPNGPLDAYGQAHLVNGAQGETFTSYKMRTMSQLSQFKWVPKRGAGAAAAELLSPSIRFSIDDCMDLPPCTVQRREAELSSEQVQAMDRFKRDLRLAVGKGKFIDAVNEGVLRWKLIQIACGAIYDSEHETHFLDVSPRLKVLDEVIEQSASKIIIFAPLTSVVKMLYDKLSLKHQCARIDGSVPYKERTQIFQSFQSSDNPRIIIAHPETMAHGLTLTEADTTCWFAPIDKTEVYLQANKRHDRPGQKRSTRVVQISGSPIETEIYRRLEANQSLQGIILKLAEGNK